MFNFTIIIPHKNTPILLQRCLDSIPIRDDLQVVIVDDDSDPSVVDFENFPGLNRLNTDILLKKEGKGAGYARNVGIDVAKGKWVLFADADDFFNNNITDLFEKYQQSESDIIFFNARTDSNVVNRTEQLNDIIYLAEQDFSKSEFLLKYAFGEPWCKIVKRKLIEENDIHFAETPIHNDTRYSYLVGFFAKKISIEKQPFYTVSVQEKSVSRQNSKKITQTRVHVFAEKDQFLRNHKIPYFDNHLLKPFWECLNQHDLNLLSICFRIAKKYGVKKRDIIYHLLYDLFVRLCKRINSAQNKCK